MFSFLKKEKISNNLNYEEPKYVYFNPHEKLENILKSIDLERYNNYHSKYYAYVKGFKGALFAEDREDGYYPIIAKSGDTFLIKFAFDTFASEWFNLNPYFEYANYDIYSSSYIRDIKHGNKIILDYKDYPKETPDEK